MPLSIDWTQMANVDLLGIGDPSVAAELVQLAQFELDLAFLPVTSEDQGTVRREPAPGVAWRRGIRRDVAWRYLQTETSYEDPSRYRACDYAIMYRPPTESEYLAAAAANGRKVDFVVVRVVASSAFAQHMSHEIAARALQLGDPWTQLLRAVSEG